MKNKNSLCQKHVKLAASCEWEVWKEIKTIKTVLDCDKFHNNYIEVLSIHVCDMHAHIYCCWNKLCKQAKIENKILILHWTYENRTCKLFLCGNVLV